MNKLTTLLIITTALWAATTTAKTVDEKQAQQIAAQFFGDTSEKPVRKAWLGNEKGSKAPFYIFNNSQQQKGWVIVSGDDRAMPVLAYSDHGSFDDHALNPTVQWWLSMFDNAMTELKNAPVSKNATKEIKENNVALLTKRTAAIKPILLSEWSQSGPYFYQCPKQNGVHCVTGCHATAMAQVMYHFRWPEAKTAAIPSYTPPALATQPELPPVVFKWKDMKPKYTDSRDSTSAGAVAVATLMHYVGQALQMRYTATSSATWSNDKAFSNYFGYSKGVRRIMRQSLSTKSWHNLIYSELAIGRPVVMGGSKSSGGHAFVCDGYDGKGLFHINWGWGGYQDGYFAIDILNPNGGGTGSASGDGGYVLNASAVIGIEPPIDGFVDRPTETFSCYGEPTVDGAKTATITRSNDNDNFKATLSAGFCNDNAFTVDAVLAWGIFDNNKTLLTTTSVENDITLGAFTAFSLPKQIYFGQGLKSGTYFLKPMARLKDGDKLIPLTGADANYIKAEINGKQCRLTSVGTSSDNRLEVVSLKRKGASIKGRPIELRATINNKSFFNYHRIYLVVDGVLTASAPVAIKSGNSGVVSLHYLPASRGRKVITLYADEACKTKIYSAKMEISDGFDSGLNNGHYNFPTDFLHNRNNNQNNRNRNQNAPQNLNDLINRR